MTSPEEGYNRRNYDKEIWVFIGEVKKHMENDAVFKGNYLKVETRVGNVENRVTSVEEKHGFLWKSISFISLIVIGISSRLVYKLFH